MFEQHETFSIGNIEVHITLAPISSETRSYTALGYIDGRCITESRGFVIRARELLNRQHQDFYHFDSDLAYIVYGIETNEALSSADDILAVTLIGTDASMKGSRLGDTFIAAVAERLDVSVIALECSPLQNNARWRRGGSEDYESSHRKLSEYYLACGYAKQPLFNVYSKRVMQPALVVMS